MKGVATEEEKTEILLKVLEESVEEEYNVEKLAIKSLLESTRYKWHFENDNIKVLDHNKNTDEYGGHSYIVFQIDETIYKLDYETGSFGDDINDVGELKKVQPVTREYISYE